MKKVVINKCYGGFGLSEEAIMHYAKLKGLTLYPEPNEKFKICGPSYWLVPKEQRPKPIKDWNKASQEKRIEYNQKHKEMTLYDRDIPRDDLFLVQTVEELGEKANGDYAELAVVEVPDDLDYEIEDYDGREHIAEKHRTWG